MPKKTNNILDVLRSELELLKSGYYTSPPHAPWRASYIFEDSPSCLNFNNSTRPHPCNECPLIQLVPADLREQEFPCRYIPLNDKKQTVESLYRTSTHQEMEEVLRDWLNREIAQLEAENTPRE